jgi:hypothetical protein
LETGERGEDGLEGDVTEVDDSSTGRFFDVRTLLVAGLLLGVPDGFGTTELASGRSLRSLQILTLFLGSKGFLETPNTGVGESSSPLEAGEGATNEITQTILSGKSTLRSSGDQ